jgi:hypothetical protein
MFSPTRWIKTHHITASVITLNRVHNINFQDFNNYLFLTYIYSTYIILTEVVILLRSDGDTATFVRMLSFNNIITLNMAGILAETCW